MARYVTNLLASSLMSRTVGTATDKLPETTIQHQHFKKD
jgi:hypothetical protein